jgi:hypothetical protein
MQDNGGGGMFLYYPLNNNLQEYGGLEMSLGLPPNIIDSITFRGVGSFYYTYR